MLWCACESFQLPGERSLWYKAQMSCVAKNAESSRIGIFFGNVWIFFRVLTYNFRHVATAFRYIVSTYSKCVTVCVRATIYAKHNQIEMQE